MVTANLDSLVIFVVPGLLFGFLFVIFCVVCMYDICFCPWGKSSKPPTATKGTQHPSSPEKLLKPDNWSSPTVKTDREAPLIFFPDEPLVPANESSSISRRIMQQNLLNNHGISSAEIDAARSSLRSSTYRLMASESAPHTSHSTVVPLRVLERPLVDKKGQERENCIPFFSVPLDKEIYGQRPLLTKAEPNSFSVTLHPEEPIEAFDRVSVCRLSV